MLAGWPTFGRRPQPPIQGATEALRPASLRNCGPTGAMHFRAADVKPWDVWTMLQGRPSRSCGRRR